MGAQGCSVSARRRKGSGSPQRRPSEQIWITGSRSGSGKMPVGQGRDSGGQGPGTGFKAPLPIHCPSQLQQGPTFAPGTFDIEAEHSKRSNALPLALWWVADHMGPQHIGLQLARRCLQGVPVSPPPPACLPRPGAPPHPGAPSSPCSPPSPPSSGRISPQVAPASCSPRCPCPP